MAARKCRASTLLPFPVHALGQATDTLDVRAVVCAVVLAAVVRVPTWVARFPKSTPRSCTICAKSACVGGGFAIAGVLDVDVFAAEASLLFCLMYRFCSSTCNELQGLKFSCSNKSV